MRRLFAEKSQFSPPLIWLRLPIAIFVFVCVCIFVFVYFSSFRVYLYLYLKRICVFLAFSGFTCCSLSSSPHQPAFTGKRRRSALRLTRSLYKWDFNPLNGISGRVCEFWPRFSVFLPRMQGFGEKIWVKRVLKKNWKSAGFWILLPILDWKSVR